MPAGPFIFGQVRLDDDGVIDEAIPCIHCGRELAGQSPEAACPGCGKAIDDSVRPDMLRFQSPSWLATLSLGTVVVFIGVLAAFVLGVVRMLANWEYIPFDTFHTRLGYALMFMPTVLAAGGLVMVAWRQPLDFEPESLWSMRRLAQAAAGTTAALIVLMLLADGFKSKWGLIQGLRTSVKLPWQMLIHLCWLVAIASGFAVARELARRASDMRLARLLEWNAWGTVISLGLVYTHLNLAPVIGFAFRPSHTLADDEIAPIYYVLVYSGYAVNMLVIPFALITLALSVRLLLRIRGATRRYAAERD
jgi:hypothetical protein